MAGSVDLCVCGAECCDGVPFSGSIVVRTCLRNLLALEFRFGWVDSEIYDLLAGIDSGRANVTNDESH